MSVIKVENLSKVFNIPIKDVGIRGAVKNLFFPKFERKIAVDNLNFSIDSGEIVGYIGVNGAGKSTTIKMLTGVLSASNGKIDVLGRDPQKDRVANAKDIGVVFGQRTQLWWDLALIESLNLIAKIYELPADHYKTMLDEFSERLDLGPILKVPIRNMSLGQKMRAELAAALIHKPKIVYLDEPTIGLDLIVKENIRDFIKHECELNGMTVLLTTHDLGDIEKLCKRVMIIDQGKLIYDGPLETIINRFGKYREITFEAAEKIDRVNLPTGSEIVKEDGYKFTLRFDRNKSSASKIAAAVMQQIEVKDFSLSEPDLSTIVKQIYNGALTKDNP